MPPVTRIVRVLVLILVAVGVLPDAARAAPQLRLDRSAYVVVRPFRYVEARRFEGGWNRGADVLVTRSAATSPIDGVVRVSATVAGREVVTIAGQLDGVPAVVTFTGLDTRSVRPGDPITAGDPIGSGTLVHVGAYDPSRRSRYFPVAAHAPAAPAAAQPMGSGVPVADALARRLHSAILGLPTNAAVPALPAPRLGRVDPGGVPARAVDRMLGPMLASMRGRSVAGAARAGEPQLRVARMPVEASQRLAAAASVRGWTFPRRSRADVHARSGMRVRSFGDTPAPVATTTPMQRGTMQPRDDAPAAPGALRILAADAASRRCPARRCTRVLVSEPGAQRDATPMSQSRPAPAMRRALPRPAEVLGGLATALVIGLVAAPWLRRRRRAPVHGTPLRAPLPVLLPHVRPYAYPVVRVDGASVFDDIALAWPDPDPGTHDPTDDVDPARARAAGRTAEHA